MLIEGENLTGGTMEGEAPDREREMKKVTELEQGEGGGEGAWSERWDYAVESFTGEAVRDDELRARSEILEKMMGTPMPEKMVADTDKFIADRVAQQQDDPELEKASVLDKLIAQKHDEHPERRDNPIWELTYNLRGEKESRQMARTPGEIFGALKESEGSKKMERAKALQAFGMAMQEQLEVDSWEKMTGEEKLGARAAEEFKLQGDIAQAELLMLAQADDAGRFRGAVEEYAEVFDDYATNDDIRSGLKADLREVAGRLRSFALEKDELGESDKNYVEADFTVEPGEKAEELEEGMAQQVEPEAVRDYGYKTERYKQMVERLPIEAGKREQLRDRGRAVDAMMVGARLWPQTARQQLEGEDFVAAGRDKQADGEVVRLIPDKYFVDKDIQARVEKIRQELAGGRAPDEVIGLIASRGERRDLVALKIIGARLAQDRALRRGEWDKWAKMSEEEKQVFRLGEEIVHRAEMAVLEEELNKRQLKPETAKVFYNNYSKYLQNADMSIGHRSRMESIVSRLKMEAGIKELGSVKGEEDEGADREGSGKNAAERVLPRTEGNTGGEDRERPSEAAGESERERFNRLAREHYEAIGEGEEVERMKQVVEQVKNYGAFSEETERYLDEVMVRGASTIGDAARARRVRNYSHILIEDLRYGKLGEPQKKISRLILKAIMRPIYRYYNRAQTVAGFEAEAPVVEEIKDGEDQESRRSELGAGFVAVKSIFSRKDAEAIVETRADVTAIFRQEAAERGGLEKIQLQVLANELEAINKREKLRMGRIEGEAPRFEFEEETGQADKIVAAEAVATMAGESSQETVEMAGTQADQEEVEPDKSKRRYYYEAKTKEGEVHKGNLEARSLNKARRKIAKMGWEVEKLELIEKTKKRAA